MPLRRTLAQHFERLPTAEDRARLLGRLEGLEMAMRICRNRSEDLRRSGQSEPMGANEADTCTEIIRLFQVQVGAGVQPFGDLTSDEVAEIERIWV